MIRPYLFLLILFQFFCSLCTVQSAGNAGRSSLSVALEKSFQSSSLLTDIESQWWEAIKGKNVKEAKEILANYTTIDIEKANKDGKTPLEIARSNCDVEMARFLVGELIQRGCDPNKKDGKGKALSHYAFEYQVDIALIRKLIAQKSFDPNLPDPHLKTSLHLVLGLSLEPINNPLVVFGWLRKEKILPSEIAIPGVIFGYCNFFKWRQESVIALLKKGAHVSLEDRWGRTPLYMSVKGRYKETYELLVSKEVDVVNQPDKDGKTPLYIAAEQGNTDACKFLVSKGADVNKATKKRRINNKYGYTALHIEASYQDPEDGYTPLHIAAAKGHIETCRYLVEVANADISKKSSKGETAWQIAKEKGHTEIVELLQGRS